MSENGRLLALSYGDLEGTLFGGPVAEGTHVATNVLNPDPDLVSISQPTGTATFSFEFNEPKFINCLAIINHNISENGTIQIQAFDEDGYPIYDETRIGGFTEYGYGQEPGYGGMGYGGYAGEEYANEFSTSAFWSTINGFVKEVHITLTDNTIGGYIQVSRIKLGKYWSPRLNYSWDSVFGWDSNISLNRTFGGSLRTQIGKTFKVGSLSWNFLSEAENSDINQILKRNDGRDDVFWSGYPELGNSKEQDNQALCLITGWSVPDELNYAQKAVTINLQETASHA